MKVIVKPSKVSGAISAPASKSAMQRACAAALIRKGKTTLENFGQSDDDKASISIITQLGAKVEQEGDLLLIDSSGINPESGSINCGESGLAVRMFTPIAALSSEEIAIEGSGSLLARPLDFFDLILPRLGVQTTSKDGRLPLKVKGPIVPADIEIDGTLSSQFLTGLLLAYSAGDARHVTISVNNLKSKPYIDLTLQIMRSFGLKTPLHENYEKFYFDPVPSRLRSEDLNFTVEGDWSGAAFFLVAGAVAGEIQVNNLLPDSLQADRAILGALEMAGAYVWGTGSVKKQKNLRAFQFDATNCPDLFPPLVALAIHCEGETVIKGVSRLEHKESNRAVTLRDEFASMGVEIILHGDDMIINGKQQVRGGKVSSRHDHRIAMACAVAALNATEAVSIDDAMAVNKSYPSFWEHLQQVGVEITLES